MIYLVLHTVPPLVRKTLYNPFTVDKTMRRFRKTILLFLLVILLVVVVGGGALYYLLRSSLPGYPAAFAEDMDARVRVVRDDRGVAHIRSNEVDNLFFTQGYVHADERLWQMEFNRRVVQGRLSEVLGPDLVGADRFLRTLGLDRIARRVLEKTSPEGVAVMASYAEGVNARIQDGRMPPELLLLRITPEPWRAVDIAGVLALMAYDLGTNWQEESLRMALKDVLEPLLFQEIMPPYDDWDTPVIWRKSMAEPHSAEHPVGADMPEHGALSQIEAFLPRSGSNSWVVSPDRWSGKSALLANDPHLSLGLPSIWFENSLELEGEFRVYGWSIPGSPGVVIGHNDKIAWGMTNIGDTQDLFLERRHPDDPHRFFRDGQWYAADVLSEEIRIKGRDEPEIVEVIITKNGSLISADPPVSLKWTAHYVENSTVDAVMGMNRAANGEAFRDALAHFSAPVQNIVYADIFGNIGFQTAGLLPIRKKGKGLLPSPGWDSSYGWKGFIPSGELPALYNPPQGYIITANHRVAGDDYPHLIAIDDASPYRMMRIEEVLSSNDALTLTDMKDLQTDWYNKHAAERLPFWMEQIEAHAERSPDKYRDIHKTGLKLLKDWQKNPLSLPEKAAPLIYANWYLTLMADVFREEMGEDLYRRFIRRGYMAYKSLDYLLEKQESAWFGAGMDTTLAESYIRTIDQLSEAFGPDPEDWQWQDLQTVSFEHVMGKNKRLRPFFSRGPYSYGGDYETVGRAGYSLTDPFQVNFAAGLRFLAVMTPDIETHAVIAGGQSGHFMAQHYDDQLEMWRKGAYYRPEFSQ
ncbi:MAG: penicillin acylase family protein [Desulfosalsimonadaceae bacterium]